MWSKAASAMIGVSEGNMAKTNKRQHFLAQFYLRNFAEPIFSDNLCYYDMEKRRWERRTPYGVGWFPHLCSMIDMEGSRTDEFDQFLKLNVEDPAAPALRKLATNGDLDPNERSAVALFIALTAARSPEMMNGGMTEHLGSLAPNERARLDTLVQRWCNLTGHPHNENSHSEFLKPGTFEAMLVWSQSLQSRLLQWNWYFVPTTRDRPFVTSDRPIYAYWDPAQNTRFVSVPISSEIALIVLKDDKLDAARDPTNLVVAINRATMEQATEFVVTCKDSFPGDDYLAMRSQ